MSGGIAAYRTVDLVSQLKKMACDVHVVCSENALKFVSKLSLQTISGNKVYTKQFDEENPEIDHINLADEADLVLIAPATANTIAKLANGLSDSLLADICLATKAPVMIAPAMNTNMWEHKTVQKNLEFLVNELNYQVIDPDEGELACGHVGLGRLADLDKILLQVSSFLNLQNQTKQKLSGQKVLVTAGGTREAIDPVRFIANRSSGKMGLALADAAHAQGAEVILVSTVDFDRPYPVIRVDSALEMHCAVEQQFKETDILIMAAAVADYRPAEPSDKKIKKTNSDIDIQLIKNPDILSTLSLMKKPEQFLLGFALESESLSSKELIGYAQSKLENKNLDMIVANNQEALDSDDSEIAIITRRSTEPDYLPRQSKTKLAEVILDKLCELRHERIVS